MNAKKINKYIMDPDYGEEIEVADEPKKQKTDPLRRTVVLKEDDWFETEISYNFSSVHVPTSIYDLSKFSGHPP